MPRIAGPSRNPLEQNKLLALATLLVTRDPLLTSRQAAEYLALHEVILRRWRQRNIGPPYVALLPCTIRYRLSALNAFALMRERQTDRLPALSRGRFPKLRPPGRAKSAPDDRAAA